MHWNACLDCCVELIFCPVYSNAMGVNEAGLFYSLINAQYYLPSPFKSEGVRLKCWQKRIDRTLLCSEILYSIRVRSDFSQFEIVVRQQVM